MKSVIVLIEQEKEVLIEQMAGLGLPYEKIQDKVMILDICTMRKTTDMTPDAWFELFKTSLRDILAVRPAEVLILDTLDGLMDLGSITERREEIFYSYSHLKSLGLTSLIITNHSLTSNSIPNDFYEGVMSDTIIALGLELDPELNGNGGSNGNRPRYIQCLKHRGANHPINPVVLEYSIDNKKFKADF